MVFSGYFIWWYGAGLVQSTQIAIALLNRIADVFSLDILFKTWFAPWKNDVMTAQNVSLGDQVKIWEMNLASRIVGFLIRTIVMLVCLFLIGFTSMLAVISLVLWLALPVLSAVLPFWGLGLIFS